MEQISLFNEQVKDCDWVYDLVSPSLQAVIADNNAPASILRAESRKGYLSIFLNYGDVFSEAPANQDDVGRVVFRIHVKKTIQYFEVSAPYADPEWRNVQDNGGFIRKDFEMTESSVLGSAPMLAWSLDKAINSIKDEFACCSRYEQCSAAGKCITPLKELAIKCTYRKNLRAGKCFF